MYQFFGQKVYVFATIIILSHFKAGKARPDTLVKSLYGVGVKQLVPNCEQIQLMRSELNKIFTDVDLHTSALRLGFHDCVGGCDGCVNLKDPSNAGLEPVVTALEKSYLKNGYSAWAVSRADFWALAALVSVERGVKNSNQQINCGCEDGCSGPVPCFSYEWGRSDCSTSPKTDILNDFPVAEMNADQMFSYFQTNFGFNKQEVVALMGAHTLGGAKLSNSGFTGVWTPGAVNNFDNSFYKHMLDGTISWKNIDVGTNETGPRWQWSGEGKQFLGSGFDVSTMFNTDLEVFFNLTLDASGKSVCQLDTTCFVGNTCGKDGICSKSQTFDIAFKYAKDQSAFIRDFQAVMEKMERNGYLESQLSSLGGSCSC